MRKKFSAIHVYPKTVAFPDGWVIPKQQMAFAG